MRLVERLKIIIRREAGVSYLETVVALAILSIITVTFLTGLATTSKAAYISDEKTTAESLAQSQMEWVKNSGYSYNATTYSTAPIPGNKDYMNYSVTIDAEPLHNPDDGIQKIIVAVIRSGKKVSILEGYKVER